MKNVFYKHDYPGRDDAKMLRLWFKKNELEAIQVVAADIAPIIGKDCYLIPIPNKDGRAVQTFNLANWLAMDHPRIKVLNIMKCAERNAESNHLNFFLTGPVPTGKRIFLLDNIIETGLTAAAALKLVPSADVVVHSIDRKIFDRSTYKSHFTGVYLCNGDMKTIFDIADKAETMKIELKNIEIYDKLSEETIAFVADLYINDFKAGLAKNDGHGGMTFCQAYNAEGQDLIRKAETYCKTLPPKVYSLTGPGGEPISISMTLDHYVDDLLSKFQFERDMKIGILVGKSYDQYYVMEFNHPIDKILKDPNGVDFLKKTVMDATGRLEEGQSILNTNLPDEVMNVAQNKELNAGIKNSSPEKKKVSPVQKSKPATRKRRPK